mmetsp:Transcript_27484/g.47435  ORF Transcript_27484/g.47435 Transcript_27484/m.47435 type:complete len:128 (+) Transcript_27484:181-564(+)
MLGSNEVSSGSSTASGYAKFVPLGSKLHYHVVVSSLPNITMGHLHLAAVGKNGPVVVPLTFLGGSSGLVFEGTLTSANFINALAGKEMADLLEAIQSGNIYVNVHTAEIPGGALRDQLQVVHAFKKR